MTSGYLEKVAVVDVGDLEPLVIAGGLEGLDPCGGQWEAGPLRMAAPGPPWRSWPGSWGQACVGNGDHDQDDEEPGSLVPCLEVIAARVGG